jgi:hypothetical protein
MAGLKRVFAPGVPAIHVFSFVPVAKTSMPGTSPGMTMFVSIFAREET